MSKQMTPNQRRRNQNEKAEHNQMSKGKSDKARGESTPR